MMKRFLLSLLSCCFLAAVYSTNECDKAEVLALIRKVNDHWQASHAKPGNAFWHVAAYHTGNMAAYEITKEERYRAYSEAWAEHNLWSGAKSDDRSKWKYNYGETNEHVLFGDWQICFQSYIDLYHLQPDDRKIARAREVMEYQMSTDRNDYWWWADGLYMVMPVMTKLYRITGNKLYLEKLYEYFSFARKLMHDEETGLFYRDGKYVYPKHQTHTGKKDFWARGNGWVFAALAKVLCDLPTGDPHRSEYISVYQSMAKALKASQQAEGHWTRSILDENQAKGYETSGTAFFAYGFFWGINNGLLAQDEYAETAHKAWKYLSETALQPDGTVGYVQPIGERADQHKNVGERTTADFGVGAFLLAASERYRYLGAATQALNRININTITEEGAWCWFADPRAIHYKNQSGTINTTCIGYIDVHGAIKATQINHLTHTVDEVLIRSCFQPDDHNNPTFLVLPDERIMVFYSRHTDEPCFYYRISRKPGDITTLGREVRLETANNTTYPSPFILSDAPDHIYLCWRGIGWHPTIARLTMPDANDNVKFDWGPHQLLRSQNGAASTRPYAKYVTNGKDKIYLAYTTTHPDNRSVNYVYLNYVDIHTKELKDIKGNKLSTIGTAALHEVDATTAYKSSFPYAVADNTPLRNWLWEVVLDKEEKPVIAEVCISEDKQSHDYYHLRWTGKEWKKTFIANAGGHFHQTPTIEKCYSGGMAIDKADPNVIYASVPVDGKYGRVYELKKFTVGGNGILASAEQLTFDSPKNNVRPFMIGGNGQLVWMYGNYYDWIVSSARPQGYPTAIRTEMDISTGSINLEDGLGEKISDAFTIVLSLDEETYYGDILKFAGLTYTIPRDEWPKPFLTDGRKIYASTNVLGNSDRWKTESRGTNGKWYAPTKLSTFQLAFTYGNGALRTYINGLVDQSIDIPRLRMSKFKVKGGKVQNVKCYNRVLRPEELKACYNKELCCPVFQAAEKDNNVFGLDRPDYNKSPLTGMMREHWFDAAEYLLNGAFSYIQTLDDPMKFPRQSKRAYPRDGKPNNVEILEGYCRTLFMAAPLLKDNPGLILNNIKVADYYRHNLLNLLNTQSPVYREPRGNGGPSQTLVEFGALAISLSIIPEILWEPLTKEEQDAIAALLLSYGDGPTIGSNWRFFNIFILSFFKDKGYEVNDERMLKYLDEALAAYRGCGWYNDSPAYDYYSMWAFQMYGPLWAHLYGNKYYPDYAQRFMKNLSDLVDNYPYMFSEEGKMNMWGRSIPYRFASVIPLAFTGYLNDAAINYGWMRRIASGTMLQFLQNPDMMEDGIPSLGYYGLFEPAVQIYSCRGSVFWMGKAFLALLLPEDNPFWTAKENNGPWEKELKRNNIYNKFQEGSNLLITNYPNSGASEMRSWCHESVANDWQQFRSSENYNKLAYNTEFPWLADGKNGEISMNYGVRNANNEWEVLRLYTFRGFENGIYRRDAVLETNKEIKFQLADIPLPNGILRVDRITSPSKTDFQLGHYSLPELDRTIQCEVKKVGRNQVCIIDNGHYQLAMIALNGWDSQDFVHAENLHPVGKKSTHIAAKATIERQQIVVTLQLWKKGSDRFSESELSPVKDIKISEDSNTVSVLLKDGSVKTVSYADTNDVTDNTR